MSADGLEQTLRNLTEVGKLVKDRGYRQVWRFEHDGRPYYLKFYPREGTRDAFRRFFRGSPAAREFIKLHRLQTAQIPAPRPIAALMGFSLGGRRGDAVVLEAIEPSVQLDYFLNEIELRAEPIPNRLRLAAQIRDLLHRLAKARLGHEDLHLGNFLLAGDKLYLLDAYAVRNGGLTMAHLMKLGHAVDRYATRTDLLRGWYEVGPGGKLPARNPTTSKLANSWVRRRITGKNRYFGHICHQGWQGSFFKLEKFPRRWSAASALRVSEEDWQRELPGLLDQIERDALPVLKRSKSGDVLAAEVTIGGRRMPIILKRPRNRYWYRYVNQAWRYSRAQRTWLKAWKMIFRNLPTAWPLMYIERRTFSYVTDALLILERVPGETLARVNFDAMPPEQRDLLLRRTGRILRTIDRLGFGHYDAKASNWIVRDDEKLGPSPVMIDIDGVRHRPWAAMGIKRLLRSLRENRTYSADDSLSLCRGYSPAARLGEPDPETAPPAAEPAGEAIESGAKNPA